MNTDPTQMETTASDVRRTLRAIDSRISGKYERRVARGWRNSGRGRREYVIRGANGVVLSSGKTPAEAMERFERNFSGETGRSILATNLERT